MYRFWKYRVKFGVPILQGASHRHRLQKGFTLIEVVIVVAILALLSSTIYAIMSQTADSKTRIEAQDEIFHKVRLTFVRMVQDISSAYLEGQGHKSSSQKMKTVFVGKDLKPFGGLTFSAFAHLRLYADLDESDQCEIAYYVEQDSDTDTYSLMRRESKRIDEEPEEGGDIYVLMEDIAGLEFEYYDAKEDEWKREWDSEGLDEKDQLPSAVRISIKFVDTMKRDIELTQIALIPMTTPITF